ncbi:mannose-ethanolamine phosphotransferase gpi13 [Phlyctochytrium planicorne]|nr:mannose-ethanolamine phosphotransferase gpi13 [Phlyctochytrium planicorne]
MHRKLRSRAINELKASSKNPAPPKVLDGALGGSATTVILSNLTTSNWFLPRLSIILFTIFFLHAIGVYLFANGFLLSRLELDTAHSCQPTDAYVSLKDLGLVNGDGATDLPFPAREPAQEGCWMDSRFKRAVVIVVDALRFDFTVYNESLDASTPSAVPHYINKLPVFRNILRDHPDRSLLVRVRADAPTTTLQRLKALTTGTLPTFVDAGSNFGGAVIAEDNLLDQLVRLGKRITFMGDDTWVGLYPTQMNKSYPYPSFNVQDLHTVDNGCVEHLFPALDQNPKEWDILIAHFLGVDHAGHSFGPYTLPMAAKLTQMNEWLERTFSKLDEDTVALVIGDHGMDPKGDHGGDSENEVNAALFVYSGGKKLVQDGKAADSTKLKAVLDRIHEIPFEGGEPYAYLHGHRTMPQIDFVPTFSLLLGLPIPFGNLGTIIPELFLVSEQNEGKTASVKRLLDATRLNSHQILRYLKDYSSQRTAADFNLASLGQPFVLAESMFEKLPDLRKWGKKEEDTAWEAYYQYTLFMRNSLVAARRIWARFDVPLIVMGAAVLGLSIVCTVVYAVGDWLAPTASSALTASQALFLVGTIGGAGVGYATDAVKLFVAIFPLSGEDSVMSKHHEVLFASAMIGMLSYLVYAAIERLSSPVARSPSQSTSKSGTLTPAVTNLLLAVLLQTLHAMIPTSNSFTIHEEPVTSYLLQFFGLYTFTASFGAGNDSARGSLLLHSLLFMVLTRISSTSTICREETLQASMCYPTFNFIPNSSVAAPHTLVALVALIPIVIGSLRASMRGTENLQSTGAFLMDYGIPAGVIVSAVYWTLDTLEGHHLFARAGEVWGARLTLFKVWWAKMLFLALSLMCLYVWASDPICIGLKKELVPNTPSSTDSNIAGPGGKTATVRLRLFGVRNAMGAAYLVFVASAYVVLVMFQKPMGGVMLGVEMLQILCLVEIVAVWREDAGQVDGETAKSSGGEKDMGKLIKKAAGLQQQALASVEKSDETVKKDEPSLPTFYDLSLLTLHGTILFLVGQRAFFATGHQATLSSIQWELAFVGLDQVNWYISPIMVGLNTFGGPILALLSVPLLPLWRRPLVSTTQLRTIKEVTWSILWHSIAMGWMGWLATVFCGHFRRHLMVWKIFAPKFIFADAAVLILDVVAGLVVVLGVWLPWRKYREFLDTMEKKGLM